MWKIMRFEFHYYSYSIFKMPSLFCHKYFSLNTHLVPATGCQTASRGACAGGGGSPLSPPPVSVFPSHPWQQGRKFLHRCKDRIGISRSLVRQVEQKKIKKVSYSQNIPDSRQLHYYTKYRYYYKTDRT